MHRRVRSRAEAGKARFGVVDVTIKGNSALECATMAAHDWRRTDGVLAGDIGGQMVTRTGVSCELNSSGDPRGIGNEGEDYFHFRWRRCAAVD